MMNMPELRYDVSRIIIAWRTVFAGVRERDLALAVFIHFADP